MTFYSRVYHPQVTDKNELDLSKEFPTWDANNHYLWHVLAYVKKIFYKIDVREPANPEAAQLYDNSSFFLLITFS